MVALTGITRPGSGERRRAALGAMHTVTLASDEDKVPLTIPNDCSGTDLDGLVCLVTGGGGGIGFALAQVLAGAGAVVVVADRNPEVQAKSTSTSIVSPTPLVGIQADISDEADVTRLVTRIVHEFGRIDVVVNNAAIAQPGLPLDIELAAWRRLFAVNVDGVLLVTQAVVRQMRQQSVDRRLGRRGAVVSVTSLAAERGRPLLAAYAASKAALNNLTASFSEALRTDQITVFGVCPGNHREGMWGYLGSLLADASGRSVEDVEGERTFHSTQDFAAVATNAIAVPELALTGTIVLWDGEVTLI